MYAWSFFLWPREWGEMCGLTGLTRFVKWWLPRSSLHITLNLKNVANGCPQIVPRCRVLRTSALAGPRCCPLAVRDPGVWGCAWTEDEVRRGRRCSLTDHRPLCGSLRLSRKAHGANTSNAKLKIKQSFEQWEKIQEKHNWIWTAFEPASWFMVSNLQN